MKAKLELEFKDLPLEKIQKTLFEILNILKSTDMIEDGGFVINTPSGVVTEKCIVQENKVIA